MIRRISSKSRNSFPLPEFISSHEKSTLSVPKAFFNTLNRVISVRNGFSEELSRLSKKKAVESDARHSYFVSILEEVGQVLKPFSDVPGSGSSDAVERLANKFDALKVYEPSQEFLNAPDVEMPAQAGNDKSTHEADPWESLDDALVAFYMMCRDLNEIQDYIKLIWEGVFFEQDGMGIGPAVLAVVANIAIKFSKSIAEEVIPVVGKYGGHLVIATELITRVYPDLAGEPVSIRKASYESFNFIYFYTANSLAALASVHWDTANSFFPEGAFGVCDFETHWESKTYQQKLREDNIIASELWFECFLLDNVPDYPCTDEFIRGVREFREIKEIPFSLVFAAQVNLDIHHVTGNYAEASVPIRNRAS
ncbi:hypothetical protein FVEN_g2244 [Fusarium venenatum]|uniref:uncharacterized protein n=1 Tax=Fusarium venenatum TaxID=56646 RepID=UPI001DF4D6D5|nr:hypothetical protein FVEN_g2244 [Fusarium venenatum]KAH6979266.1 hypothetical protein EDB82DRAFT_507391 [Fusarium venenatum]